MPDRIVRDEILESERWLSLKDNADRLAYVALLLKADPLGNFTAEPFRLMRMWRDFGINSLALVSKTLIELCDHDLVRLYEAAGKKLLHIPRFNQYSRYLKRIYPLSPWTTEQQKQLLTKNSQCDSTVLTVCSPISKGKVSTVKVSTVKEKQRPKLAAEAAFVLPEWVPKMQWDAWIEARTKRRNTPTEWAKQLAIIKLEHLKEDGHSPARVLANSAFNGWAGLFPPKDD